MALMPKRVKFRKWQRGKNRGNAQRGNTVVFGDYGLQSLDHAHITAQQIEAGRMTLSRFVGGEGKYWIRIFPHRSVTSTPLETRMGKGKGEPDKWVAIVKPGTIMFEVSGIPEEAAKMAFARVAQKMPVKLRMANRR